MPRIAYSGIVSGYSASGLKRFSIIDVTSEISPLVTVSEFPLSELS